MLETRFSQPQEFVAELEKAHRNREITGPLRLTCRYTSGGNLPITYLHYVAGFPTVHGLTVLSYRCGAIWGVPGPQDDAVRQSAADAETIVMAAAAGLNLDVRSGEYHLTDPKGSE